MPNKVNKRKGFQEDFKPEKLKTSIEKAAREAGYPDDEIAIIVEEISSFIFESVAELDTVDSENLRFLILSELDKRYPNIAKAWRNYDQTFKGRTY